MKLILIANILFLLIANRSFAEGHPIGKVESIRFETAEKQPLGNVPEEQKTLYRIYKMNKHIIPEGAMILGSLFVGSKKFKLTPKQKNSLSNHIVNLYSAIEKDADFRKLPSVLPEVISGTKQEKRGHYFLYTPPRINKQNKSIIFLHGYGGNFKYYLWILRQKFPNHLIFIPSMGISWSKGNEKYLKDMLNDFKARTKVKIAKPWLIALSAGGPAGFHIYNDSNDKYKGLISIASAPKTATALQIKRNLNILMINGKSDNRFPIDVVKKRVSPLRKIQNFEFKEINGDHFFLFTEQNETFKIIKEYMKIEVDKK